MLNEEKIRIMTGIAMFEKRPGGTSFLPAGILRAIMSEAV